MEIKKSPKISNIYFCELCNFKCCKNSKWDIHITRPKHQKQLNGNKMEIMEMGKISTYVCECKKEYKTNSGLWKHKKNCDFKEKIDTIDKK